MSDFLAAIIVILLIIFSYEYKKNGDNSLFGSLNKDIENYINRRDTTILITMDKNKNILDTQYVIKVYK